MPLPALAWRTCVFGAVAAAAVAIAAVAGGPRTAAADGLDSASAVRTVRYVIGDYAGFAIDSSHAERHGAGRGKGGFSALVRRRGVVRTAASCGFCAAPPGGPWPSLIDDLADKPRLRQLDAVNRLFNRVPYAEDRDLYGARDYWATPSEFLRRNAGDCEDYAVAKYAALRALGWSADALLVVAIRDHKQNVDHAVLAAKLNGRWYYLDNRSSRLLRPRQMPFYQPVYALNERGHSVFVKSGSTRRYAATGAQHRQNAGGYAG